MSQKSIAIDQLLVENSCFYFSQNLYPPDHDFISDLADISPILVYQDNNNQYHLVDGFFRIALLKKSDQKDIQIQRLTQNNITIIQYLADHHKETLEKSTIAKIKFIQMATKCALNNDDLISILKTLRLPPKISTISDCNNITTLFDDECLNFFEEKNYHIKQLLSLMRFPLSLIQQFVYLSKQVHFTASSFLTMIEWTHDICRLHQITETDLFKSSSIKSILEKQLSPQQKADLLKNDLQRQRFPILSCTTNKINDAITAFNLPSNITINWDKTLENKALHINIKTTSGDQIDQLKHLLFNEKSISDLKDILGYL